LLFLTLHISDEKEIDWKNIKKRLTHQNDNDIRGKKGGDIMKVTTKLKSGFSFDPKAYMERLMRQAKEKITTPAQKPKIQAV